MIKKILAIYPLYLLLGIYFIFSLITYKDYGITADEEMEYKLGKNLINYFANRPEYESQDVFTQKPWVKYYYHLYPMILSIFNAKNYYEWYHFENMLFASLIIVFSYVLMYTEYKNKWKSLIVPITIILTPRFFGDIPANPKDMPFAVMYFISLSLIYLFGKKDRNSSLEMISLGIILGITQSMRIIGYSLYGIYLFNAYLNNKLFRKDTFQQLFLLLGISHLFMYLTYPFISQDIFNVVTLFKITKEFTPWNGEILYLGQFITREQRPWHYLFIWLLISTPIYITIMHFVSLKLAKENKLLRILLFTIYLNFVAYLLLKPIIYNGVRHFLYILPLLSITAGIATIQLLNRVKYIYLAFVFYVVYQMAKLHPYEYIYFNDFAKYTFPIEKTFETDYWGASYKEATTKVLRYIEDLKIKDPLIYACNVDYAIRYYSKGKFDLTNESSKADIIICDSEEDLFRNNTQSIIDTITKGQLPVNIIRQGNRGTHE